MKASYLGAIAIAATLTIGTVGCAAGTNPCAGTKEEEVDPCAGVADPCAAADPCAGKADPCAAADPCAGKADPCAADPCAGS